MAEPPARRADIRRVAVVSTGVIGASWAALFLAHGLDVEASDPAADAEMRLRAAVVTAWPILERMGLEPGASPDRLSFHRRAERAVEAADFVQENGPERLDLKRALFDRLDAATPSHAVIATSSSSLTVSEIAADLQRPERIVLGHPFNPPHLIPLVEVGGGERTSDAAIETALTFYRRVGRRPIRLRRELRGHVANRLQAALWREAFHLLHEGVVSAADIDAAISHGPGLRWALLGPLVQQHLSGGPGGIEHVVEHLGPTWEAMWADLGRPTLTPELEDAIIAGVHEEMEGRSETDLAAARDAGLAALLQLKARDPRLP